MNRRTHHVHNTKQEQRPFLLRDSLVRVGEEPPLASHLVTPRLVYRHHGIYVGNGRVIHYAGLAHGLRRGPVEEVSLEQFAQGHAIRVRHDVRRFDCCEVVERARSRLGESCYRVLSNNCVHFCAWALRDESRSGQVERLCSMPRAIYERIELQHRNVTRVVRLWLDRLHRVQRTLTCTE